MMTDEERYQRIENCLARMRRNLGQMRLQDPLITESPGSQKEMLKLLLWNAHERISVFAYLDDLDCGVSE